MFEQEFAKLPVAPPRRVESLPGLRLKGAIPKWAIMLPLFFVVFFLSIPLSLMSTDPSMRLAMGPTDTVHRLRCWMLTCDRGGFANGASSMLRSNSRDAGEIYSLFRPCKTSWAC